MIVVTGAYIDIPLCKIRTTKFRKIFAGIFNHFFNITIYISLYTIRTTVIHSSVKCGITVPTSGERNNEINIEGLPEYSVGESHIM